MLRDDVSLPEDPRGSSHRTLPFSMSGDGVEDIEIPSVLMRKSDAQFLQLYVKQMGEVVVRLTSLDRFEVGITEEEEHVLKKVNSGKHSDSDRDDVCTIAGVRPGFISQPEGPGHYCSQPDGPG